MKLRKDKSTKEEIQDGLIDCIMENDDIFNIKAFMRHTPFCRPAIQNHLPKVMEKLRKVFKLFKRFESIKEAENEK
jgi:hypothetical protein